MSRFATLADWLDYLEQLHPKSIDLGLERVYSVARRLNLLNAPSEYSHAYSGQLNSLQKVVTVAGTNGKGSCVASLEQALLLKAAEADGSDSSSPKTPTVGSYTSPHLHHYCERICIDGQPVCESLVCDAFAAIDQAREEISLSYFEFGTLAALWIFIQKKVPYMLLEVGLGGRLDAVNIVDADIAVVTSIDVDHEEWLGNDRDIISQEKLGIAREGSPLIIAESSLTPSLRQISNRSLSFFIDRDFSFELLEQKRWRINLGKSNFILPVPGLPLNSVISALMVLQQLKQLPDVEHLTNLMHELSLPGRFERTRFENIDLIYDVAHNPAAARVLAKGLRSSSTDYQKTYAVMAVMADKNHAEIIKALPELFDHWFVGGLSNIPRAASDSLLTEKLIEQGVNITNISREAEIEKAFEAALTVAKSHDRIVVFGSFYTVAAVQHYVSTRLSTVRMNTEFVETDR